MPQKTAKDFDPEVLRLFDKYVHGIIPRRDFLKSVARFAVGVVTAEALLDALQPNFAQAQLVAPTDARIQGSYIDYDSPNGSGKARGYLVRPAKADKPLPTVLVIHENRGLNPHIEDITRRLALDGFIAFAPDALYTLGGYPGDEDKARELFAKLDQTKIREDFIAAVGVLKKLPGANGKVGAVGFCYGGGIVNFLATRLPDLNAGVPFYGNQPKAEDVHNIKAPLLIHYAGVDERINAGWPAYEAALKANHVNYQAYIYPDVQHGFNNNTTPRYDETAARAAWKRTVDFFNAHLRT